MKHIKNVSGQLPIDAPAKATTKACSSFKDSLGLCTNTKSPV